MMTGDASVAYSGDGYDGTAPMRLSMSMVGVGTDAQTNVGDVVFIPTLGGTFAGGFGSTTSTALGSDGSLIEMRPSSTEYFALLLPGLGVHSSRDSALSFSGMVRTGYSYNSMHGTATAPTGVIDLQGQARSFMLVAELEVCGRIADSARLCAFTAPKIYEYGWATGITFGARLVYDKGKGF